MKLDTGVIITKGVCYVVAGAGANLATSLAQWANSGEWPAKIQWIVIIVGACVGAATNMLSFLSGSFGSYRQQMKADSSQETQTVTTEPTKPKVDAPAKTGKAVDVSKTN